MLVIPVPHYIYLAFLCGLTTIWVIWIVTDVKKRDSADTALSGFLPISPAVLS